MPPLPSGVAVCQNMVLLAFWQIINDSLHVSRRHRATFRVVYGAEGVLRGMSMDIVLLTPDREKGWQRFVENCHQPSLAHALGWRDVVERTYHHVPFYLMAMDGQKLAGVLPLFLIRSPFFGRLLATAPYLSYGGLLADDERTCNALIRAAREAATEREVKYVEIRGLIKIGQGLVLKDKYCTFRLPLSVGPDVIWKRFEGGKVRRAVRKALKAGLIVERGQHLKKIFAEIMSRHMRDLGTPFHRTRFYQSILEEFPQQSAILMARQGDRYVGGILTVTFHGTVYWLYGAGLREYHNLAPISLLIWEAIRSACEQGFMYFDFGRSRWDSGTNNFNRKWGAQPHQLF
jgi:serine/alanine adding enzyme